MYRDDRQLLSDICIGYKVSFVMSYIHRWLTNIREQPKVILSPDLKLSVQERTLKETFF